MILSHTCLSLLVTECSIHVDFRRVTGARTRGHHRQNEKRRSSKTHGEGKAWIGDSTTYNYAWSSGQPWALAVRSKGNRTVQDYFLIERIPAQVLVLFLYTHSLVLELCIYKSMDMQPSNNPSALMIFITGSIQIGGDNPLHFCEFFHLVSTGPGQYYVHNDVFRLNYGL